MVYEGWTVRVDWRKVVLPLLVADVDDTLARKELSVATIASRHHAVEHIDTTRNSLQDIYRSTHAHQVARLILWQYRIHNLNHRIHHLRRLTHSQTTNSIAIGVILQDILRRLGAKIWIATALHDWEQRLIVSVLRLGLVVLVETAIEPTLGQSQRLGSILLRSIARRTLVECHHNVGANGTLGVDYILGRKEVARTIDVRLEVATLLLQLTARRKREDLETTAIGKHRLVPS